jgi:hypothetical protein
VVVGVERERRWRSPRLLGGLIVVKRAMVCGGWLGVGQVVAGYYIHGGTGLWGGGAGGVASQGRLFIGLLELGHAERGEVGERCCVGFG